MHSTSHSRVDPRDASGAGEASDTSLVTTSSLMQRVLLLGAKTAVMKSTHTDQRSSRVAVWKHDVD